MLLSCLLFLHRIVWWSDSILVCDLDLFIRVGFVYRHWNVLFDDLGVKTQKGRGEGVDKTEGRFKDLLRSSERRHWFLVEYPVE